MTSSASSPTQQVVQRLHAEYDGRKGRGNRLYLDDKGIVGIELTDGPFSMNLTECLYMLRSGSFVGRAFFAESRNGKPCFCSSHLATNKLNDLVLVSPAKSYPDQQAWETHFVSLVRRHIPRGQEHSVRQGSPLVFSPVSIDMGKFVVIPTTPVEPDPVSPIPF